MCQVTPGLVGLSTRLFRKVQGRLAVLKQEGGNAIMAYEQLVKDTETQLVFLIEC